MTGKSISLPARENDCVPRCPAQCAKKHLLQSFLTMFLLPRIRRHNVLTVPRSVKTAGYPGKTSKNP